MTQAFTPPYAYRRRLPRFLAGIFDRWAPVFFKRSHRDRPASFNTIAVIRADQIGDIVLTIPFLSALRVRYPHSRIVLITTSAGQAMLQPLPDLCETRVFDAPWFRGERGVLQAVRDLKLLLRAVEADAVVDLRGDIRHLWAARHALPKAWIEGYGITGGGFLADHVPPYRHGVHAAEKCFDFLDVTFPDSPLKIDSRLATSPLNRRVRDVLPMKGSQRVAIHMGAGTDAKRWPELHWKNLVQTLLRETGADIVWIGDRDADDRARIILSLLAPEDRARSTVICHLLGLGELGTLLKDCDLLITADSGPGHVAAAAGIPVLVIFSGANDPNIWKPLSVKARILIEPVTCAPCGLKVCARPVHDCMEGITPQRTAAAALEILA